MKQKILFFIFLLISLTGFNQSVNLSFPNGGQHFTAGVQAPHNIIWTASGVSSFNVYFSTDSGATWTNIASNVTDKFLSWSPPSTFSDSCLIRITDNTETYSDTSSAMFSIVPVHNYYVQWNTSMGDFTALLHNDLTPIASQNFMNLAERNFYDNLIFHRVIENFMIQDGDPLGNGTGGPGYEFDDEIVSELSHSFPGVLAMANSGANTNGSQYYITVAPTTWLDGGYTIFGKIVDGMDVVYAISKVETDGNDKPLQDVYILSIRVVEANPQLAVISPKNDDSLIVGYSIPIKWNSQFIEDVKIEFSSDNGTNWTSIVDSMPAYNEVYNWTVPNNLSNQCVIKVTDLQNDTIISQTGIFSIRKNPVVVTRLEFFENVTANIDNPQNLVMCGKSLRFKVKLKNNYSQDLSSIDIKLTLSDTTIVINVDSLHIGSLSQNDEIWTTDFFEIQLPNEVPSSGNISLKIGVSANNVNDTLWVSNFNIPMLSKFPFMTIDDNNDGNSQGNGNQTIEAGETIEFLPKFNNTSYDTIYQVYGKLTTVKNYVNIWNNVQGSDGIVYDTTNYHNFTPIAHSTGNAPENNFVFDYNADATYQIPFVLELHGYLDSLAGNDYEHGGFAVAWGVQFIVNSDYPAKINDIDNDYVNFYLTNKKDNINFIFEPKNKILSFNVNIYDLSGRKIYSETLYSNDQNKYQLSNSKLNSGLYIFNLKLGNLLINKKFFVE